MTAVGGFVDISQLVFSGQAGSMFGYSLISAFAFSTVIPGRSLPTTKR